MTGAATTELGFFTPVEAGSGAELRLSLQELVLTGKVVPVGAHLWVRHLFRSGERKPVEVVYTFALPRDAALRRFRVVGQRFSVESSLQPVAKAEEIYEEALSRGNLATMAREYRDGLVSLYVGNLKPEETVVVFLELVAGVDLWDEGFRFRFPFTLAPGYHPQARAAEVAPGVGEMELPESFEGVLLPPWVKNGEKLHQVGLALEVWLPEGGWELNSPSHRVRVAAGEQNTAQVSLAVEEEIPNRDLVLDLKARRPIQGVFGGESKDGTSAAVVLPSAFFGKPQERQPRDVVFVLDRSGSMEGSPLEQAKKAIQACLAACSPGDRFNLVLFGSEVEQLAPQLLPISAKARERAEGFLQRAEAGGGTELAAGLAAASQLLPRGGDVFLVTDGQVLGTETIVAQAKAAGVRIHCLGIGAASQDHFLASLSAQTEGLCRFLTPRERVDTAALELFASIRQPLAWELAVRGDGVELEPAPPRTVFAGKPVVIFATWEEARGRLELSWRSAQGTQRTAVPLKITQEGLGETVHLLQGAKRITELEATAEELSPELRATLEQLGQRYGLANRAMALVAVVTRPGDAPGEPPKTEVVPVGMPEDTSFLAYFAPQPDVNYRVLMCACVEDAHYRPPHPFQPPVFGERGPLELLGSASELLVELVGKLLPDGGMPGKDEEERWSVSAVVLLLLQEEGQHEVGEPFFLHHGRLLSYLKAHPDTQRDPRRGELVARLEAGETFPGPWADWAEAWLAGEAIDPAEFWHTLGQLGV